MTRCWTQILLLAGWSKIVLGQAAAGGGAGAAGGGKAQPEPAVSATVVYVTVTNAAGMGFPSAC